MRANRVLVMLSILSAAVIFLLVQFFFFSNHKIAYVDSTKLLSGYNAMISAKSEFDKKQKAWQDNIDSLTKEVKEAINKYEKLAARGTDSEKQLSRDLINVKQKQLFDYQNATEQNASQEEGRLTQNVLSTVNAYLIRYGKKKGYKMILIAANGNIAYADPSTDITDIIIEHLNSEYAVPVK